MIFGSVCSGIEAVSVAWRRLPIKPAWFSEIEPFPCAVLAHHYPEVPNLGDMTTIKVRVLSGDVVAPDVLVGGTPCQAFSLAGLRGSLDDNRGQLTLEFVRLADAIDDRRNEPAVILWENVPGVLNTKDNAFGCFLAGLAGEDEELQPAGGKWSNAGCVFGPKRAVAWRILDAQYFGVAQRRRRVFVVASARAGFDPAKVLFEFDSLRRDSAPINKQGEITWWNGNAVSQTLDAVLYKGQMMPEKNRFPVIAVGERLCLPPTATNGEIAQFAELIMPSVNVLDRLRTTCMSTASATTESYGRVLLRKITPTECERLQGFPDNWTLIPIGNKQSSDTVRYKALGNSMAVPVMKWIGKRIYKHLSGLL